MPAGKCNFPYHAHSAQWELYLVISGKGTVPPQRRQDGSCAWGRVHFGPDEPHQLINSGDEDFIFYLIADNPIGESWYQPDSGKWNVKKSSAADRVLIKGQEADYFDGEE